MKVLAKKKLRSRANVAESSAGAGLTLRQLSEALVEVGESFGLSQADFELALEDRGWLSFAPGERGCDLDPRRRNDMITRCRLFWRADPLAKQAVRLWTDYAVGKGITYEAEDDDEAQAKLDKFIKYRKNKKLTSSKGQQRLSKKLLVDGDIFFAVFDGDSESPKTLRTIEPLQITEIISDPDDEEEVLCYKRVTRGPTPETLYYKDWAAEDDELEGLKDPETKAAITVQANVVVYHLSFDDIGKWGNGLLSSAVDWSNAHRGFMKDRVAITRGLAKFVTKLTVKGGQAAVDAMQRKLQSSLVQTGLSGSLEKNPRTAPGSSWVQNAGIDMQATPRTTGASDAMSDGRMLKLQFCAGTGIMEHYFGDGANANLAVATAMELPMLKSFMGFQELWMDFWRDIFAIVLEEDIDDEPAVINISLPKILQEDLVKLGTFLTAFTNAFPEAKVEDVMRLGLEAVGMDDIDLVLDAIKKQKAIDDAKAAKIASDAAAAAKAAVPVPGGPPVAGPKAPELQLSKESIDCLNHFAETFKEVMTT